jgi:hypothetical protein
MSSPARILANRRNGRAGTGPKTAAGRARASRNARRHGFTLPVLAEPSLAPEVAPLAAEIVRSAGAHVGDAATHALACRIAEAMIDLRRIRSAKQPLVAELAAALVADPDEVRSALRALARLDRYERYALWRRKTAIRAFAAAVRGRPVARIERSEMWGNSPGLRFAQSGLRDRTFAAALARQNEPRESNDINTPRHRSTT